MKETLDYFRRLNKRIVFVTNNSTRTRQQQVEKFHKLGITWVSVDDILTSAYAAAAYLHSSLKLPTDKKVYVVGHEGIVDELKRYNYVLLGSDADASRTPDLESGVVVDENVGAVVVGFDYHFNYYKMVYATQCVMTLPECAFVATNKDARAHVISSAEWPGGGTMVAALEHALGRAPVVAGKPSPFLAKLLTQHVGIDASEMCMVGDRLDTDIAFGNHAGMKTLLVFTGVTQKESLEDELKRLDAPRPHFMADSLADLRLE